MKPCAHQRSKQRCQDLRWKVRDRAKIFCFEPCMNCVTNTFLLVSSSVRSKQLLCFVHGQSQKREKNMQQIFLSGLIIIPYVIFRRKKHSLPPISITRYLDPGLAKTSDTLASPFLLENSLIFFSRQYAEAHSGSKAMSSCSGLSADAIPALK